MDLSCIISSGELELYVLGMLPEEEAYKIEQLAVLFPEVRTELDRISESLEKLAVTASTVPSPNVKESLMNKLGQMKREEQTNMAVGSMRIPENDLIDNLEGKETPVIPMATRKNNRSFLLVASVIGLVISLGAVLYLMSQNNEKRSQLAAVQARIDTLNQHFSAQQQQLQASSQMLQMLQNEDYLKINLADSSGMMAQVFWNTHSHEVFIADMALPQPERGKQYQLWAIVDGKPVDAGLITNAKQSIQKMKTFDRAEAFAISIENEGGSPVPTEVFLVGKI